MVLCVSPGAGLPTYEQLLTKDPPYVRLSRNKIQPPKVTTCLSVSIAVKIMDRITSISKNSLRTKHQPVSSGLGITAYTVSEVQLSGKDMTRVTFRHLSPILAPNFYHFVPKLL